MKDCACLASKGAREGTTRCRVKIGESLQILSWNVNGLRAILKKGFLEWLSGGQYDVVCIQETKTDETQIPKDVHSIPGYTFHHVSAARRGYSGVALFTKRPPKIVQPGFGVKRFDQEGRTLVADYDRFLLYNVYFPNGKLSQARLRYKLDFYQAFLSHVAERVSRNKKIVICGDVNTAHREIDLARPRENQKISGFLPDERAWMDELIGHGFIDTFRFFHEVEQKYSWWDYRTRARERNVGWRIDYCFISMGLRKNLRAAFILDDVFGSDHCPVGIDITI